MALTWRGQVRGHLLVAASQIHSAGDAQLVTLVQKHRVSSELSSVNNTASLLRICLLFHRAQ